MAQRADDQIQGGLNKKDELLREIEVLEKEVKELKRYVKHQTGCQAPFMPYKKRNPCTCGLDNLLND